MFYEIKQELCYVPTKLIHILFKDIFGGNMQKHTEANESHT